MAKRNKERGEPSIVQDQGLYASSCGYCKSDSKTSVSYGLWAHSLSVYDYQDLLNRGWRRSGNFLYKPEMAKTCCPAYTIRLKAESFSPSKEQNRVMHRLQRYLEGTYNGPVAAQKEDLELPVRQVSSEMDEAVLDRSEKAGCVGMECDEGAEINHADTEDIAEDLADRVTDAIRACSFMYHFPADIEVPKVVLRKVKPTMRKRIKTSAGEAIYSCSVAFTLAAALSKHKDCNLIVDALQLHNESVEKPIDASRGVSPAVLADLFASNLQNEYGMHGFVVEACNGHLNFLLQNPTALNLLKNEDSLRITSANHDSDTSVSKSAKHLHVLSQRETRRVLEVRMRRSAFDPEEFALYKRYQIAVHHDKPADVRESSYVRFLVDSPLTFVPPSKSGTAFCGFGSFHQQYWIDGRLVAVGVVDILPSCLSSKYLFWDPDLAFLSLGKYSAFQEIEWVQKAHQVCPSLEYYYLGYYIHTCPKMRYKGAYRPSELLCPIRFQWVPYDIAQSLLDVQPFVCLSDAVDATVLQKDGKDLKNKSSGLTQEREASRETVNMEDNQESGVSHLGGAASSSKESEDVSNILLKVGNQFLQFKNLQGWTVVPQKFVDSLVCDLRKYAQVVGPILATKMAYVLG